MYKILLKTLILISMNCKSTILEKWYIKWLKMRLIELYIQNINYVEAKLIHLLDLASKVHINWWLWKFWSVGHELHQLLQIKTIEFKEKYAHSGCYFHYINLPVPMAKIAPLQETHCASFTINQNYRLKWDCNPKMIIEHATIAVFIKKSESPKL